MRPAETSHLLSSPWKRHVHKRTHTSNRKRPQLPPQSPTPRVSPPACHDCAPSSNPRRKPQTKNRRRVKLQLSRRRAPHAAASATTPARAHACRICTTCLSFHHASTGPQTHHPASAAALARPQVRVRPHWPEVVQSWREGIDYQLTPHCRVRLFSRDRFKKKSLACLALGHNRRPVSRVAVARS